MKIPEKVILVLIPVTIISVFSLLIWAMYQGFEKSENIEADRILIDRSRTYGLIEPSWNYAKAKEQAYMAIKAYGVVSKDQHQTGAAYSMTIDQRITKSKWIDLRDGSRIYAYGPAKAKIGDKVIVFINGTDHTFELDN